MTVASPAQSVLVAVFARVHAYAGALDLCVRARDQRATLEIAVRLAAEIADGRMQAELPSGDDVAIVESRRLMFEVATGPARARLAAVCAELPRHTYAQVERASLRVGAMHEAAVQPTLNGLDVGGANLQGIDLCGLRVTNASWIANMTNARFFGCAFETGDFSYARFDGSLWLQTRATRSSFRDCSFEDVTLGDATFVRCDLRRAQFAVAPRATATFVDCDLRGATLGSVLLARGRFIRCQMASEAAPVARAPSHVAATGNELSFAGPTPRTLVLTDHP